MRRFSVSFGDVAVSAAQDAFQIEAKTTPAILLGVFLSQSSDVGDAESEGLLVEICRVTDAVTNDLAEVKLDGGDNSANANLAINETTQLATGIERIHREVWHINQNFIYLPTPELQPVIEIDNALTVRLAAPGDAITASGVLYFGELGS